jgi:hypothetical protein
LEHLDIPDEQLLAEIGYRLAPIFEIAYGTKLNAEMQTLNIGLLSEAARRSYLAISDTLRRLKPRNFSKT